MKPARDALVTAIVVIVIVVAAVPALLWLAQDRLIFFPQPIVSTTHLPPRAQPLTVTAPEGTKLHGFVVPARVSPAPAILYFGGNAEEVSWTVAAAGWPPGYTRIAVNYRGYGASEGKPSAEALLADGVAIYDAVAARADVDRSRIVVVGRSLGTAVAARVAAQRPVARTILVSPYDSLAAVGKRHYPLLPVSAMLRHRFVPLADAARCRSPLLVIVAPADAVIPVAHSRALFDAWAGEKTWREIAGADHNSLGATRDYWDAIASFL